MALPVQQVSFYDVYASLGESLLPAMSSARPDERCLIMKTLDQAMDEYLVEANELLVQKLKKIKLKKILNQIEGH